MGPVQGLPLNNQSPLPMVRPMSVAMGSPPGNMSPPPSRAPLPPIQDGLEFKYHHDMDENGIMFFVGTQRKTAPYRNPALHGSVRVISTPLATEPIPSAPAWSIVGRDLVRCVTKPMKGGYFIIDLVKVWCKPTHYTLRHYASYDTEALRDWKLQGSNDGQKWTKLLSHKKDTSLEKKGATKTWVIPKVKKTFRIFRILQTGENSNGHWYLALSGFEIYGKLYNFKK